MNILRGLSASFGGWLLCAALVTLPSAALFTMIDAGEMSAQLILAALAFVLPVIGLLVLIVVQHRWAKRLGTGRSILAAGLQAAFGAVSGLIMGVLVLAVGFPPISNFQWAVLSGAHPVDAVYNTGPLLTAEDIVAGKDPTVTDLQSARATDFQKSLQRSAIAEQTDFALEVVVTPSRSYRLVTYTPTSAELGYLDSSDRRDALLIDGTPPNSTFDPAIAEDEATREAAKFKLAELTEPDWSTLVPACSYASGVPMVDRLDPVHSIDSASIRRPTANDIDRYGAAPDELVVSLQLRSGWLPWQSDSARCLMAMDGSVLSP